MKIPIQADQITGFREKIKKVDQFLEMLSNRYSNEDIVNICLKELLTTIMSLRKASLLLD